MPDTTQPSENTGGIVPWRSLERWSARAFFVAGAFLVGFVARNAIIAFGDGFSEELTAALYLAFVVPAELAAYVGLLGVYPRLSDRMPRLSSVGAVLVGVAGVAILGFGVTVGSALLASGPPEPPAVSGLLYLVTILTTILGFVVFGVASLRTDVFSRRVGLFLLVPPAVYVLMMTGTVVGYTPEWSTFVLSSMQAGAHVAIGLRLSTASSPTDRARPSVDSGTH